MGLMVETLLKLFTFAGCCTIKGHHSLKMNFRKE